MKDPLALKLARRLLIALLAIAAPATLAQDAGEAQELSKRLNHLFAERLLEARPLYPMAATANGLHQFDGQFVNELSAEARDAQRRYCRAGLDRLRAFDRARLSANDQLSYDVYRREQERCLDRLDQPLHLLPLDQSGSGMLDTFAVWGAGRGAQPFQRVEDYDNFLKRLHGFAGYLDTMVGNMREGLKRGIVHPRLTVLRTLRQLAPMVVDDPARSPYYQPILHMPQAIEGEDRRRLAAAYESAIRTEIVPAYRRLRDFINFEYLVATQDVAGLAGVPGGDALYAYHIRAITTTSLAPREIAEMGRREMARVRGRMEALKEASGFRGELKDWAARLQKTRKGYTSAEEALAGYRALHERVYPELGKLFGTLPKAQYEIQRTDADREALTNSLYRRATRDHPATVFINLGAIRRGSVEVSERLFLHEAIPGHHLQIALAQENRSIPGFRRGGSWFAFVEGWASYSEGLGLELGLYRDPYQHMAMLNGELNRAARMVVDVGLHADGWSLNQAIEFIRDHTLSGQLSPGAESGIAGLIDRQMARPALVLGYGVGRLEFEKLRERAQSRLGAKFDVRAFHDEVLKDGPLPFDILEAKMERWLAAQR